MFSPIRCMRILTICASDRPADLTPGHTFVQPQPFRPPLRSLCVYPGSSSPAVVTNGCVKSLVRGSHVVTNWIPKGSSE